MRKILYGAIGLAGLCLSASAIAQDNFDPTPSNINVRLGVSLPLDNALSNYGSPLIGLGVEYQLNSSLAGSGVTYLSLDYLTSSSQFSGGVYPFCINHRFYLNNDRGGHRTYAFVGVGGAIIDINGGSNTVLAARGGLGADIGEKLFFETTLLLTDSSHDQSADSISLYIGYRF
jgi:hypothetical protein